MSDVRVLEVDGVATVLLDRPAVRNAVRARTVEELSAALDGVAARAADIDVVVLAGAGPAFCAGQDLKEAAESLARGVSADAVREHVTAIQGLTVQLRALPMPVIAAVHGPAVGMGAELSLACDLRLAGPAARWQFPETLRGQIATNGSTCLLPGLVGTGRALSLMLTGEPVDAATAVAIGLADEAPAGDLAAAIQAVTDAVRAGARTSVRLTKRLAVAATDAAVAAALAAETAAAVDCLLDAEAAVRARGITGRGGPAPRHGGPADGAVPRVPLPDRPTTTS